MKFFTFQAFSKNTFSNKLQAPAFNRGFHENSYLVKISIISFLCYVAVNGQMNLRQH